jgi:ABC-type transporter Mla subunit MlaD
MATPTNYVKIGLFVVLGFAAAAAFAVAVGATSTHKKTVAYYTYFNEPVTGLDVGAPVKGRGVDVGLVGGITFAPDHMMIEVRMDLETGVLDRFGGAQALGAVHPDLRAQLASQGLTGARFVSVDFLDPTANPPPALSFTPTERYIPAAKSQQKSLEDSVTKAMEGLSNLVDTMSREGLSEKTVQAVTTANEVLTTLEQFLRGLDRQHIPQRVAATIEQLGGAVDKVDKVLDRVDGEKGLIATAQRSVSSFGEVGRNATGATRDLDQTLGEIREAAAAVRLLADELEREPDILLKGRAKASSP